jgi:hypothetical protein
MSAAKIVTRVLWLFLLVGGLVATAVALLCIIDPVGCKMADDGDPFGARRRACLVPSRFSWYISEFLASALFWYGGQFVSHPHPPNQTMKPTAPLRGNFSELATTPCRGLSLSR